jgi:hypothetical protein
MKILRIIQYSAIFGFTALAVVGTVTLERGGVVDAFHDKVGVEEYSFDDAKTLMAGLGNGGAEPEVKVLVVTPVAVNPLTALMPEAQSGWARTLDLDVSNNFLHVYSSGLADGRRPNRLQIWLPGTLVLDAREAIVLDEAAKQVLDTTERQISRALYEGETGEILVTLEKMSTEASQTARTRDLAVADRLDREQFENNGRAFLRLSSETARYQIVRGYLDDGYVVEFRGTALARDFNALIDRLALGAAEG